MDKGEQVMRPLVSTFSSLTPSPFDTRTPAPLEKPIEPSITRERSVELGIAASRMRGWQAPAGAVFYSSMYGVYGVGFFAPGQDHGDGGLGNPWLYFDASNGQPAGAEVPGTGSAGDIFMCGCGSGTTTTLHIASVGQISCTPECGGGVCVA